VAAQQYETERKGEKEKGEKNKNNSINKKNESSSTKTIAPSSPLPAFIP
jgi:hypothetical protein